MQHTEVHLYHGLEVLKLKDGLTTYSFDNRALVNPRTIIVGEKLSLPRPGETPRISRQCTLQMIVRRTTFWNQAIVPRAEIEKFT